MPEWIFYRLINYYILNYVSITDLNLTEVFIPRNYIMRRDIKSYAFFVVMASALLVAACKKDKKNPDSGESNVKQTTTTNRRELTNDSLFLYAKQIYYWNTSLPSYDTYEPRKYTSSSSDLSNYEDNLFNIGKASGSADYVSGESSLKYSYIDDITTRNPDAVAAKPNFQASVDLEGNGNDLGIRPIIYTTSDVTNAYLLFITAVYPGSDADKKGVKRGWVITKINGQTIGNDYNTEASIYNSGLSANSVTLQGDKYENKVVTGSFSVTLNKTSYKSNPLYLSKVFTAGSKKIGYLNYARFSNETNSVPVLDAAFQNFVSQGVTDLIIDLRYNGGGYVSTAEHLINLIAPSTANGIMYKEVFNATLRDGKGTIMKNQPLLDENDKIRYTGGRIMNYFDDVDYSVAGNTSSFSKAGALSNIANIVFIVSGSTASASELVINSLKPKMNVKLVGEQTYGKPVGFFPVRLENRYDVLYAMFETKNSLDQGGYFTGMIPDFSDSNQPTTFFDDPRYDFGDANEPYTATAIKVLNPSSAAVSARQGGSVMVVNGKQVVFNNSSNMKPVKEDNGEFVGMIETRHKTKKN